MKTFVKFGNYSLAICLIIVATLLAYVAIPTFGNKALIVRSGSMEPTIRTGDLIVVKMAKGIISPVPNAVSKYKEGDVIAFKGNKDPNVLTTHRIVSKKIENGKTVYQTQGDANQSPDSQLVSEEQIVGRSNLTIPKAGKIFAFAKTKNGFALIVLVPALLVIAAESSTLIKEIIKVARARRMLLSDPTSPVKKNQLLGPVGLRILMPFVVGLMFFHNSYAFFSDSASSLNNSFVAAATFPSPSPTPSSSPEVTPSTPPNAIPGESVSDIVINEINWGGSSASAADEWVELKNTTSSPINLTGWIIENLGDSSSPNITITSGTIPANGFFLISNLSTTSKINVVPDLVSTAVELSNGGEQLILKNSAANTIDAANLVAPWFFGTNRTPGPAKSMERKSPPSNGTISTNWQTALTHTNMDGSLTTDEFGTPKAENGI